MSSIIFLDVIGALIAVFMLVISVILELDHNEKIGKIPILKEAKDGFKILRTKKEMRGLVLTGTLYTLDGKWMYYSIIESGTEHMKKLINEITMVNPNKTNSFC